MEVEDEWEAAMPTAGLGSYMRSGYVFKAHDRTKRMGVYIQGVIQRQCITLENRQI